VTASCSEKPSPAIAESGKVAELQGTYGIPRGTACLASWLKGSLRLALFHPPRVAKPRHDDLTAGPVVLAGARQREQQVFGAGNRADLDPRADRGESVLIERDPASTPALAVAGRDPPAGRAGDRRACGFCAATSTSCSPRPRPRSRAPVSPAPTLARTARGGPTLRRSGAARRPSLYNAR
jgi:hypothetical protein